MNHASIQINPSSIGTGFPFQVQNCLFSTTRIDRDENELPQMLWGSKRPKIESYRLSLEPPYRLTR
jgi:hypothetical protein